MLAANAAPAALGCLGACRRAIVWPANAATAAARLALCGGFAASAKPSRANANGVPAQAGHCASTKYENEPFPVSLLVKNPAVFGKTVGELSALVGDREFVLSRIWYNNSKQMEIVSTDTMLNENDKAL